MVWLGCGGREDLGAGDGGFVIYHPLADYLHRYYDVLDTHLLAKLSGFLPEIFFSLRGGHRAGRLCVYLIMGRSGTSLRAPCSSCLMAG